MKINLFIKAETTGPCLIMALARLKESYISYKGHVILRSKPLAVLPALV